MNRSSKKKERFASDADPHGLASTNIGALVHPLAGSPIGRGATAGVVAQQSGIMPVAVTLFTVLAACHFWRLAMPVSEAVKSLVECNFECNNIAQRRARRRRRGRAHGCRRHGSNCQRSTTAGQSMVNRPCCVSLPVDAARMSP